MVRFVLRLCSYDQIDNSLKEADFYPFKAKIKLITSNSDHVYQQMVPDKPYDALAEQCSCQSFNQYFTMKCIAGGLD